MATSYELFLFRPRPDANLSGPLLPMIERGNDLDPLDADAIGQFLLSLGHHIRFGSATPLGDQYVYEDELAFPIEIIVADAHVALGYENGADGDASKQAHRVANAIALALVARFDLTLYDPQRKRIVRARTAP